MKISIITAVYNNTNTIAQAIKSVLSQDYNDIEYIVIDGNSSDGTKEIIKSYADKIDIFISEPDNGIYEALNKGINKANGEILGFLHSDDLYANKHVISKITRVFKNQHCDGVYSDLNYVSRRDHKKILRHWKSGSFEMQKLSQGWMPPHPTFFLKKSVYDKYGLFDTNFKIAADYNFMLRVLSAGISTVHLPEVLYLMRAGGVSNRSIKHIIRKTLEDIRALKKNKIGGWSTIIRKNLSKIPQFFKRT